MVDSHAVIEDVYSSLNVHRARPAFVVRQEVTRYGDLAQATLALAAHLQGTAPRADLVGLLCHRDQSAYRAVLAILNEVGKEATLAIPGFDPTLPGDVTVNGAGNFAVGGPEGDNGLSGKKLVVDAYGPRVPIGGGALSGKDLYKADRAGAILARRMAKLIVLTGVAHECTATLALFPGDSEARVVSLRGETGRELETARWQQLLNLRLESVGVRWSGAEDLVDVARYGHFSRGGAWEAVGLA